MSAIALMDDLRDRPPWPPSASAATPERDALHQSLRASCVFVVEAGRIVGIFTEQDVVRLVRQRQPLETVLIEQVMAPVMAPLQVSGHTDAVVALDELQQRDTGYLPILDKQGDFIGFVTPASLAGPLATIRECHTATTALSLKNTLLAQIVDDVPLPEILHTLSASIEVKLPGALCSVMLLDQQGRLREGGWASLPDSYIQAIDGVAAGDGVGSCGTAVARKETIIVSNIAVDPLWQDYCEIALGYGLQACWSMPILTSEDQVLGTFAVYYPEVRSPQPRELETIAHFADIAGIAIKHAQTQAALQQSETHWQFAIEGAGLGVWDWLVDDDSVFFSRQWKALLGYEEHEIGDRLEEWESRIHPDDRVQVDEALERHRTGETTLYESEHRLCCKDGSYKWVLTRGKALERAANGEPVRMLGIHTDIHDRKCAEAALQKSEAQSRAILAAIPDLMLRVSADGIYREFVTPHREFELWKEATERIGRSLSEVLPAEVADRHLHALQQVLQTGEPHIYEQCLQRGDRQQDEEVRVVQSGEDEVLFMMRDISDRKQAEAALVESEQRFRSLFESTPNIAVQGYNQHRQVLYWNQASEELYGYTQEEAIGQSLEDLILPPETQHQFIEALNAWVNEGQIIPASEVSLMRKGGSRITVFSSHIMLTNAQGVPEMYCVDIDLSARKKAEAQLQVLVEGTATTIGEEFFPALVSCIATALEVTHVIVSKKVGDDMHPLAFWANGVLTTAEPFRLPGTPCEKVLQENSFYCEHSVQQRFPDATIPAELNTESYTGIALQDTEGQAIGNLCILNQHRIQDPQQAEQILRIFAARAAAELERQQAQTALEQLNQSLEERVEQRTAELRQQKQFLQTVLDAFPLDVFWKNQGSVYQGGNQQFLQRAGLASVAEVIGKTDYDMPWRDTEADVYRAEDHAVIDSGIGLLGIIETQARSDGRHIWTETNKLPLHNLDGEVIGVVGTYQDISDRKQAELELQQLTQELAEWRDRYDIAAQASGQVLFEYDLETDQDTWGPNFEEVLGHPLNAFPEGIQAYFSHIHPEEQPAYQCILDQDRMSAEPYQIEVRLRAADGTYRWIEERGMTRYDAQGNALQVIGYLRNISDRKRMETALVESEAKSRAILGAIPDLILRTDGAGIYRELIVDNPGIEAFFKGRDPVGLSLRERLPAELVPEKLNAIRQALHTGQLQIHEQQIQCGDHLRYEEIRIAPSGDDEVILMIRDISDRKRAELALRHKTEELDRFFSLALDLLSIVSLDGYFVRLNNQWEKMLGYPLAELEGSRFLDYVHDDDLENTLQTLTQAKTGKAILNFVNRYRCYDGSYRWIEWRSVTHGHLIYAAARDITERKQTEAELRASRAYYQGILADQTDLICRFLPDGQLTFVNQAYCDFFQRSRQSLMGSNFLHLLPEADAVMVLQELNRMSKDNPVNTYEHQVLAPDGMLRWQQWTDRALFDVEGNLLEFQSVGHDITALKEAEAALLDSERRFRSAIQDAPLPIMIHAEDGEVLQINTAWTELTGYQTHEIPTVETWARQAYGEQADDILKNVIGRKYILESRQDEGEFIVTTRDGNQRIWHFSSAPLGALPDGRRAVISVAADMTQHRQAERALRTSEVRWQFALEGAGHGVWDWHIQAHSIFLSPQLKAMLGYTEAEVENSVEAWNDWIHPEDKALVEREVSHYLSGATPTYQNEHRLRCKDGSYKWILDRATVIEYTPEGDPLRMIGTHTDITESKRQELASRLLASVVESSEDAILTQDLNGTITSWNAGAVNLFGYSQAEAIGQPLAMLFPSDRTNEASQIFERLEQCELIQNFETVHFRRDRTRVEVAVTVSPLKAQDGIQTGTSIIVRDITERKQMEAERLRAEETRKAFELLEQVVDNVLAGYWDWDIASGIAYLSPGFKSMFGYADHELPNVPESWQSMIFPEDLQITQACFERHVQSRGQVPYYNEVRYRHKNGSSVWVICSGQVVEWDETGAPLRMIGCHIDISDRKLAETHIHQESAFRQQILEHMAEGLCVFHEIETFPFLHFTVWNRQMQAITGYTLDEINRLGWYQSLFPNAFAQRQAMARVERMQGGEILTDEEWYIQLQDGEQRAIAIANSVLYSQAGESYILLLIQDITVRKQAEVQLRQTNEELARATRLKDEFLANMSHELRTPLNAILGITEGLSHAFGELSPDQLDALATIEHSGSYLLDLINDILDVAKIEAGQIKLEKTFVAVATLCQSSVAFIKQPAWKKNIQLELHLPHAPLNVQVDERRVRQVLLNLLDNAVKFTPEGGKVTLQAIGYASYSGEPQKDTSLAQDTLRIIVSDSGIGIARDRIESLFEPFIQIDNTLSRQNNGTGLGLALVKRIVELHGGQVTVTSELGVGSCFTIDLPCQFSPPTSSQAEQQEQSILYPPSEVAASPVILLAEDNEANVKTTSRYLIAKGYRVLLARTGDEAVALAQSEHPNLILMDIQMPQMDGLEAIQRIRQHPHILGIPIIALTALAMSGDRDRCLTAGADEYLSKPVRLQKLVATIQRFLPATVDAR